MNVIEVNSGNYEKEILKSEKPVLIDFYANWCGPCKMMSPIVDEIAEELQENVTVGKVNVDENQDLAMEYGIMSIPTLVILKNGEPVKTFVGVTDKEKIKSALNG